MRVTCKDEDSVMEAVAAISALDNKTVRKVFEGLSIYAAMEAYRGSTEFVYPFVGRVSLSYYDKMLSHDKIVKKVSGSLSVFDNFSEMIGEAKQGNLQKIKNFIQSKFQQKLQELVEN